MLPSSGCAEKENDEYIVVKKWCGGGVQVPVEHLLGLRSEGGLMLRLLPAATGGWGGLSVACMQSVRRTTPRVSPVPHWRTGQWLPLAGLV